MRTVAGRCWRAWRERFGLAEVFGTAGAIVGFEAGYKRSGSVLAAAGLATTCELVGFYSCIALRTGLAARQATEGTAGWDRVVAAARHAIVTSLASCAVAEVVDGLLIRPSFLAGATWLFEDSATGMWVGFALGKLAADAAWYGVEACTRNGAQRGRSLLQPAPQLAPQPHRREDLSAATEG
jgi:hypothetical protein